MFLPLSELHVSLAVDFVKISQLLSDQLANKC